MWQTKLVPGLQGQSCVSSKTGPVHPSLFLLWHDQEQVWLKIFFLTIKQTSPWIIQALQNFWELTRTMCRHGCYLMVYSSVLQTTRSLISKTIFLITSERQKVHPRTIFNTNQWWWCLTLDHRTSQLGLSLLTFHHQKAQQVPQSDQVLVQMTSPDKCEVTKCIYNQFSIGFQMLNNTQVHF